MRVLLVAVSVLVAAAVACDAEDEQTATPVPTTVSAESLVRQLVTAINRGNVDQAEALFTDTATWERGGRCPAGQCSGRERIRTELEMDVRNKHALSIFSAQGSHDSVTSKIELKTEMTREAGVSRIIQVFTVSQSGGRITSLKVENDLSDKVTADSIGSRRGQ